jgi:hypothetical protein
VCLDWLKLKEEIKRGLPFESQLWRNFFAAEILQVDENTVNIDASNLENSQNIS